MTVLKIKKVLTRPIPPYEPNMMYLQNLPVVGVEAKAWRIYVDANNGQVDYVGFDKLKFGIIDSFEAGAVRFAKNVAASGDWSVDKGLDDIRSSTNRGWISTQGQPIDNYVGVIWTTTKTVSTAELTSVGPADDSTINPKDFRIQYSNDTTDGTDGTWTDGATVTDATGWAGNETRSYTLSPGSGVAGKLLVHVSSDDGTRLISTITPTQQTASNISTAESHLLRAATIAARDALTSAVDIFVVVTDASTDPDVTSGEALYMYNSAGDTYTLLMAFDKVGWPTTAPQW